MITNDLVIYFFQIILVSLEIYLFITYAISKTPCLAVFSGFPSPWFPLNLHKRIFQPSVCGYDAPDSPRRATTRRKVTLKHQGHSRSWSLFDPSRSDERLSQLGRFLWKLFGSIYQVYRLNSTTIKIAKLMKN